LEESYLINRLKSQNKIVFDFVFQYYYSGLCSFAERYVIIENVAEDIVQDLFVHFWVKNGNIVITGSLKSYLFTSVKNRCLDYLKHQKVVSKSMEHFTNQKDEHDLNADYWFAESELRKIIDSSLKKLPPRCREIFQLSRFEGLKNQDIADQLGLSKRTVELQISNALKILRKDMEPYLPLFLLSLLVG